MDDLISRKWLVDCIEEGWIRFDTEKDYNRMIHLVRDTAPPARPGRKEIDWIPCGERLPDKSGEYLVTDDGRPMTTVDVSEFFYKNGVSEWIHHDHVVAWTPLPEPYRGEQDDTD